MWGNFMPVHGSPLVVEVYSVTQDQRLNNNVGIWRWTRCQMKIMLIDGTARRHVVYAQCHLEITSRRQSIRLTVPRRAGSRLTRKGVCVRILMSVWSSLSGEPFSHEHRWSSEAFSLVYCRDGSLSILYFPSSSKHNGGGGMGVFGRDTEVERRTKAEGSEVQGQENRGGRGEKSPLNSCHCVHVNWSWSRFHQHPNQQVQSAKGWTEPERAIRKDRGRKRDMDEEQRRVLEWLAHGRTCRNTHKDKKKERLAWVGGKKCTTLDPIKQWKAEEGGGCTPGLEHTCAHNARTQMLI